MNRFFFFFQRVGGYGGLDHDYDQDLLENFAVTWKCCLCLFIYIFDKFLSGSDALFQRLFTCLYMSVSVILSCIFPNRFNERYLS